MPDPVKPEQVDKRTAQRYVRTGLLDEKAYERHNKALPDSAEKAAPVETVMFENEEDDEK